MRPYEESHPWLTFQLNLQEASYRFWLLLGEAQSKCNHVAGVPLLPAVAAHLHQVFLAKGALATTAIEGNTLSEEEAFKRVRGELPLPPSRAYLGQEIDNVVKACNLIAQRLFQGKNPNLTVAEVMEYNRLVLEKLPQAEDVNPGEIRQHSVGVGGYRGAPAVDCAYLLGRLCDWLNQDFNPPTAYYRIAFGVLKAIIAHLYLAWIHPFADGNGRTARLLEMKILLSVGVPFTAAHLLSNHYNQTRSEYYRQLDLAHRSGGQALPFIEYALQGFVDGLTAQIQVIKEQQIHVHWINYIYDRFRNQDKKTDVRRRRLALDLARQSEPVPVAQIRYITPRMAEAYANRGDRTVERDVSFLEEMQLVIRTAKGVRANQALMLAFLSPALPETL